MANPAGWDCENCRKNRLERKRRCAWIAGDTVGERRVVWARGPVATDSCPRPLIKPESHAWLEMFALWKRVGEDLSALPAKDAEALGTLEEEWKREQNGTQRRGN